MNAGNDCLQTTLPCGKSLSTAHAQYFHIAENLHSQNSQN
jgi:hypothetical protein